MSDTQNLEKLRAEDCVRLISKMRAMYLGREMFVGREQVEEVAAAWYGELRKFPRQAVALAAKHLGQCFPSSPPTAPEFAIECGKAMKTLENRAVHERCGRFPLLEEHHDEFNRMSVGECRAYIRAKLGFHLPRARA